MHLTRGAIKARIGRSEAATINGAARVQHVRFSRSRLLARFPVARRFNAESNIARRISRANTADDRQ